MKAIKALVGFMSVLLVAGLVLLGWGLYSKTKTVSGKENTSKTALTGETALMTTDFDTLSLSLPKDAKIVSMLEASGLIVLQVSSAQGERLVIVDPIQGRISGTVLLSQP